MTDTNEAAFETAIETHLLNSGYRSISSGEFDRERAIFPEVALSFVKETQPDEWKRLQGRAGARADEQILDDLCAWMNRSGSIAVLRHGFKCLGRRLHVAFFKAAHKMNPEMNSRYEANRLCVTRQLRYQTGSNRSVDVVLSLNGIPVVTMELKNPLAGQTVNDAQRQYRLDRDPNAAIFADGQRTLVHFCVDTESVLMTTKLAGRETRFLPFDKGSNGRAGNPPDPDGRNYRTSYLWEDVLQRDSLLDIVARFARRRQGNASDPNRNDRVEETLFPRYHQLDAVRLLSSMARREGTGHNYLIEHSAGSGKTHTIAWLAHHLSSLHDSGDEKVFDSVVLVTDRVALDRQLQDAVYEFEQRRGVVQKIDENSRQLAETLRGGAAIIVSTLQKFPFVARQLLRIAEDTPTEVPAGMLPTRRYAVIIDEAHSSQGGEAAADLKGILGGRQLQQKAKEAATSEGMSDMEGLFRRMAKRGRQSNISFFAFTATPKHKTLAVFGRKGKPAHQYTMRQAIEEGFILDVLRNYTTYETYFRLAKSCPDDPNVVQRAAARALIRYVRLHPQSIDQKTRVMVNHFHAVARHKIAGQAKAMVLTGSRQEAVRYKQSFDRRIRELNYPIKTLVAFSGVVQDSQVPGRTYTEEQMNDGIRELELRDRFATSEYQILIVADKYQTGFDQPLLHTMYVDKRLAGIRAVQALSRLNRVHPLKEDTFVLDFANDREEIRQAFKLYYEGAEMGEEADPSKMYELKQELDAAGVYFDEEIRKFCDICFKSELPQGAACHKAINATLDPAVSRFATIREDSHEKAELWRDKLDAFCRLYSFLSQIIPYQDSDLELLYTFLRLLSAKLPQRRSEAICQIDASVRLEILRLQKAQEGAISLSEEDSQALDGPTEVGTGAPSDRNILLSQLIRMLNEKFGATFCQEGRERLGEVVRGVAEDQGLLDSVAANSQDRFALALQSAFRRLVSDHMDSSDEFLSRYMNERVFREAVNGWMSSQLYRQLRAQEASSPTRLDRG